MLFDALRSAFERDGFTDPETARERLRQVSEEDRALARLEQIGDSEEGRPITAAILGRGPRKISLLAGNHPDEPVGPEFLRRFVPALVVRKDHLHGLLEDYTFIVIPHTNPDGEQRNRSWIEEWPSFSAYLRQAFREPPGRDMEFGFPEMRRENEAVSDSLRAFGPFTLHASLHGMGVGEGGMLLIERRWGFRTDRLQRGFVGAVRSAGLGLHDHNRKGEKGFFYLGPGFSTTPEGEAMRWYFKAQGDEKEASKFHRSSMEFVRDLGGDPLCYVTELPLFVIEKRKGGRRGVPEAYLEFRGRLPELRLRASKGDDLRETEREFGIRSLSLPDALLIHLRTLELALQEVSRSEA